MTEQEQDNGHNVQVNEPLLQQGYKHDDPEGHPVLVRSSSNLECASVGTLALRVSQQQHQHRYLQMWKVNFHDGFRVQLQLQAIFRQDPPETNRFLLNCLRQPQSAGAMVVTASPLLLQYISVYAISIISLVSNGISQRGLN